MKTRSIFLILLMLSLLSACQEATPPAEVTASLNTEFTLAPGQTAGVRDAGLTITFHSVVGDDRCPSDVECVESGPVTVSLSVQERGENPIDFTLQTFTDEEGRSPGVQFEGVTSQAEAGEYVIHLVGVTPYPKDSSIRIESSEYRVILLVSSK